MVGVAELKAQRRRITPFVMGYLIQGVILINDGSDIINFQLLRGGFAEFIACAIVKVIDLAGRRTVPACELNALGEFQIWIWKISLIVFENIN